MTEQLKYLVQELNKAPFNRNFNLIILDSLEPFRLLQLISDVICFIEERPSVDIQTEAPDETALRIFESLRILRYKPPMDPDELTRFRLGLVEGDKHVIFPVMVWLLQKIPELQKRAYLARFLVRVDVPPEFLADPDVDQLYSQSEELMEDFKEYHKTYEQSKIEGVNSEEIRQDIRSMEQEGEHLRKRIEKCKRKVESMPKRDRMLELAKELRNEMEREAQISQMKMEQRNGMVHAEQKLQRIQQQMKEIKQQRENARPEDLIHKLTEENKTYQYLVEEKLPKEITSKRRTVQELQKVMAQPAMDQNDLQQVRLKIDAVNEEVTKLIEQKNLSVNPTDDKLAIFRQQANIVQRKKESAAESLQEARRELEQLEEELKQKKSQMRDSEGNEIVTSVQFKNYVNKLRTKTNTYKKKRAELQDLRSEIGVLARTDEILRAQWEQIKKLTNNFNDSDSLGPSEDESNSKTNVRPSTAKLAGKSPSEIANAVGQMASRLEARKKTVGAMLQELRPLREQYQQTSETHNEKKQQYDAMALSLESGYSRLEQEVRNLRQEINTADSLAYKLEIEKRAMENLLDTIKTDGSFKEKLQAKINESEESGKRLREEQRQLRDDQQDAVKQMKQWRDLMRLMESKKKSILRNNPGLKLAPTPQQAPGPTPVSSRAQSSKLERTATVDTSGGARIGTGTAGSRLSTGRPPSRRGSGKSQE